MKTREDVITLAQDGGVTGSSNKKCSCRVTENEASIIAEVSGRTFETNKSAYLDAQAWSFNYCDTKWVSLDPSISNTGGGNCTDTRAGAL
mmetsp:Transcript_6295/g.15492  ORF Transcript_6295/g.15492 Transcript_6295/m.15492 type:complete len:90 (-) Transcript_6295:308-577(-)